MNIFSLFLKERKMYFIGITGLPFFFLQSRPLFEQELFSERKHKREDGEWNRHILSFFPAPITCHHPKLIMSWKLSLRKTAEVGFSSASPPPLFFSSSLCFFLSPFLLLLVYLSEICNSLSLRPYLCLPLTLSSSLLSFLFLLPHLSFPASFSFIFFCS